MATVSAFIDGALQDIELLGENFLSHHSRLKYLQSCLKNLRTFLLCARGASSSSVMGSLLSRLEDSLIQSGKGFHKLCLRTKNVRMSNEFCRKVTQLEKCIRSFSQEIIKSYITLSDGCSLQSWYQLKEFFDSLLVNMEDIKGNPCYRTRLGPKLFNAFKDKLVFFINFLRFAELRCFEPCQLQVLLTRLHVVAVKAAQFFFRWTVFPFHLNPMEFWDTFQLIFIQLSNIKPIDPKMCEIYVQVLTASNVSQSSHALTLETDKHVLGDFVESLLCNISEALTYGDSYMVSLKDQMPVLSEGLRFLRTLLTKHLENIDELHKKAKDLIGAAVNEAAIIICLPHETCLEEGSIMDIDFALHNFLERIKLIKVITSAFIFPKTNEHGFIDFLLENLKELPPCTIDSDAVPKYQIQTLQEDLVSLRSFLESILDYRKHDGELQRLWNRVIAVAHKTHFVILSLVVRDIPNCSSMEFRTIIEEINLIKLESLKIVDNHYNSDSKAQRATKAYNPLPSQGSTLANDKIMVTLDDEEKRIKEYLTSGSKKLDIISIVGMPGLGKTTLARSVYDNPSVRDLFRTSAWCVVSQGYRKKDLLLRILGSVDPNFSGDKYSEDNEQGLEEKLKQCLLKKKYLIVLDDIWDIEAWSALERSFPDDANSSRILLTSRDSKIAKKINPNREPHALRQLTDDECWDLLQKKLSCIKSYPLELGMKIAKKCRGLPLTVVIVAGILANSDQDGWEWIAKRLSLSALSDIDQCMYILELSFRKLPKNLQSCLLYFASFPEDAEIPVKKLIWLWIAEGFIEKYEPKSLEDVAKDYMKDLIGRSLVMVSKKRSTGGVKTCRIHDLLHEYCAVKAKKEKFLSLLRGHDELFAFLGERDLQRLCVHSTVQDFEKSKLCCLGVRSLLLFAKDNDDYEHYHFPFIFHFFKLLKVLDLENINLGYTFPSEIELLVELRYLAIRGMFKSIPSTIVNLSNLETLLVYAEHNILLPDTLWNMSKLRVLWLVSSFSYFNLAIDNLERSSDLHNLDTFSALELSFGHSLEKIMRKLPNIRRLKCQLRESKADCKEIVVMDFLSRLESLHLRQNSFYPRQLPETDMHLMGFRFPENLKKLTLSEFHSSVISKSGELSNLVVLKLRSVEFDKGTWDMNEEWRFPNLKSLKLEFLGIYSWIGTDGVDHFPRLEQLVLRFCGKLKKVPSCLWDIATLQMIEVNHCPISVVSLIMQIKEYQKDNWGNEDLQVLVTNINENEMWRRMMRKDEMMRMKKEARMFWWMPPLDEMRTEDETSDNYETTSTNHSQ